MSKLPSCNCFQPVSRFYPPRPRRVLLFSLFLLSHVCFPTRCGSLSLKRKPRKTYFNKYVFLGFLFPFFNPPTLELATSRSETVTPALGLPQRPLAGRVVPATGCWGVCARALNRGGGSLPALRRPAVSGALPAFRRLSRGCVAGWWAFFAPNCTKNEFC